MGIQKKIALMAMVFLLCNCGGIGNKIKKKEALQNRIMIGMDRDEVKAIAGNPDIEDNWEDGKFIYYYSLQSNPDEAITRGVCEPVFFHKNRVIAVGHEMMEEVKKQKTKKTLTAKNKKKEKELYARVIKIPASDVNTNYKMYKQLVQLNPNSRLYRTKRDLYKTKLQKQKKREKELLLQAKTIPIHNYMENYEIYRKLAKMNPDHKVYREKRDYFKARLEEKKKEASDDKVSQQEIKAQSCYIIGYRFGRCSAKANKELPCDPRNIVEIPERCEDKKDTLEGIEAGKLSVN